MIGENGRRKTEDKAGPMTSRPCVVDYPTPLSHVISGAQAVHKYSLVQHAVDSTGFPSTVFDVPRIPVVRFCAAMMHTAMHLVSGCRRRTALC